MNAYTERPTATFSDLLPLTLKDGSRAVLVPVNGQKEALELLPPSLVKFLADEFNAEIERGQTYPQLDLLPDIDTFVKYWFVGWVGILVKLGDTEETPETHAFLHDLAGPEAGLDGPDWGSLVIANYYIKPNYPGRCSHNCNAGFMVNPRFRGVGAGSVLGKTYLHIGPRLGYTYSVFNLVFVTNSASCRIWDQLGFEVIGRVPGAAVLKGFDDPVDALIYGRKLNVKDIEEWKSV